jgi:hypothetical protein
LLINHKNNIDTDILVITRGSVKILFKEKLIDLLGAGSVIGEMSLLAGIKRTADAVAETPVTAMMLPSKKMLEIIASSPELEIKLWHTAGLRFAENLLGTLRPYRDWSQFKFRKWLSEGEIIKTSKYQNIRFHNKVGVLLSGTTSYGEASQILKAPVVIDGIEAVFPEKAWVFVSGSFTVTD